MSIAPIRRSVMVRQPPSRAFELFVGHMARWWPAHAHVSADTFAEITVESHAGGRWFQHNADGSKHPWGRVLAWEPPHRLLLAWQIDASFTYDPNFETELELTFVAEGDSTRVELEHRLLERFGPSAERMLQQLGGGWPTILGRFAALANASCDSNQQVL